MLSSVSPLLMSATRSSPTTSLVLSGVGLFSRVVTFSGTKVTCMVEKAMPESAPPCTASGIARGAVSARVSMDCELIGRRAALPADSAARRSSATCASTCSMVSTDGSISPA